MGKYNTKGEGEVMLEVFKVINGGGILYSPMGKGGKEDDYEAGNKRSIGSGAIYRT